MSISLYDRPANRFVATFIGNPPMNIIRMRLDREGGRIKGTGSQLELWLNGSGKSTLPVQTGGEVDLGIRPEHIFIGGEIGEPVGGELHVSLVEPLGPEKLVHLTAPDSTVIITKVPTSTPVVAGDKPEVKIDTAAAHAFDVDSGIALL